MHHGCRGQPLLPPSPTTQRPKIAAVGAEGAEGMQNLHKALGLQYSASVRCQFGFLHTQLKARL